MDFSPRFFFPLKPQISLPFFPSFFLYRDKIFLERDNFSLRKETRAFYPFFCFKSKFRVMDPFGSLSLSLRKFFYALLLIMIFFHRSSIESLSFSFSLSFFHFLCLFFSWFDICPRIRFCQKDLLFCRRRLPKVTFEF